MKLLKISTAIIFSLTISQQSSAEGGQNGNGGNILEIAFQVKANAVAAHLLALRSEIVDVEQFKKAIRTTRIESTDRELKLNGVPKDAINYPSKKLIIVNRTAWVNSAESVKSLLVIHEYLGILGVEDSSYQVSTKINSSIPSKIETVCGQFRDYGDSIQIKDQFFKPYITSIGTPLKDPKNIETYLLRNGIDGKSCFCVSGEIQAFDRAGETAYAFARLTSLKSCETIIN